MTPVCPADGDDAWLLPAQSLLRQECQEHHGKEE